ncbi:GNAT family N-acetyltransferase [Paenibacillus sp.]|uniref:GNAT family N-acetyltransferase n=1 Tax=Paenibacillus sp. TaxID=58172 RepID=UPI002D3AF9A8|nr:GNAT family N-acetyltransferase [Paenibacillus sp.]HZG86688.1 GNAT family N-acetyltransferase [Paenibacillus sp.]
MLAPLNESSELENLGLKSFDFFIPEVVMVNNVTYKKLQTGDELIFSELVLLFNKEFESPNTDYVNNDNIARLLSSPFFVCIVAIQGDEVIGGLTGYELDMYDRKGSTLYLYDIAVGTNYQRKGIGSSLIRELVKYCKSNEIRDIFVQADAIDQHAVEFYKNLGGEKSSVYQFTFAVV